MQIYIDKQGEPRRVDGEPLNLSPKDRKELKRSLNIRTLSQKQRFERQSNN